MAGIDYAFTRGPGFINIIDVCTGKLYMIDASRTCFDAINEAICDKKMFSALKSIIDNEAKEFEKVKLIQQKIGIGFESSNSQILFDGNVVEGYMATVVAAQLRNQFSLESLNKFYRACLKSLSPEEISKVYQIIENDRLVIDDDGNVWCYYAVSTAGTLILDNIPASISDTKLSTGVFVSCTETIPVLKKESLLSIANGAQAFIASVKPENLSLVNNQLKCSKFLVIGELIDFAAEKEQNKAANSKLAVNSQQEASTATLVDEAEQQPFQVSLYQLDHQIMRVLRLTSSESIRCNKSSEHLQECFLEVVESKGAHNFEQAKQMYESFIDSNNYTSASDCAYVVLIENNIDESILDASILNEAALFGNSKSDWKFFICPQKTDDDETNFKAGLDIDSALYSITIPEQNEDDASSLALACKKALSLRSKYGCLVILEVEGHKAYTKRVIKS